jgi:hypothetical protein
MKRRRSGGNLLGPINFYANQTHPKDRVSAGAENTKRRPFRRKSGRELTRFPTFHGANAAPVTDLICESFFTRLP